MHKHIKRLSVMLAVSAALLPPSLVQAQNLLANGDFSGGNTGFSSGYTYIASGISQTPGTFGIRTSPQSFNTNYNAFGDHTTGSGNMLMLDGSTTAGITAWQETVTVTPNTPYIFSGWATASDNGNVPTLRFFVNGVQAGSDFLLSTSAGVWQQFTAVWNSGATTGATLSVEDLTLPSIGNDFALDDFSFTSAGVATVTPTAFTYQGRLNNGANLASGSYDLMFSLFTTNLTGAAIAGPVTNSAVSVNNGLFTTPIDFGPGVFLGEGTWLEIGVVTNGGMAFTTLVPRQPLTATPTAIYAATAGSVSGLTVQANASGAPNVIGGSPLNTVSGGVVGATIAGGGAANYSGSAYTNSVTGNFGTVGGGSANTAVAYASVAGGFGNTAGSELAAVGGGLDNSASGGYSTAAGGEHNLASGNFTTVSGGFQNSASSDYAVAAGGQYNSASGLLSAVAGGFNNKASGDYATAAGGEDNTAGGEYAIVAGGIGNNASGTLSFAAGESAQAVNRGAFVWADAQAATFSSTVDNQFAVRASGGMLLAADVQMGTNSADYHHLTLGGGNSYGYLYGSYNALGDGIHLGYNFYNDAAFTGHIGNTGGATSRLSVKYGEIELAVGAVNTAPSTTRLDATLTGVTVYGTFNNSSDRNAKQDFAPINPAKILDKVLQLPVSEWSYKTDAATRHIGPMGQDFYSTFNIGTDEKHIAPIDEGGVALAAIQGLNQKLEETRAENEVLKQQLAELKAIVQHLASGRLK